MDAVTGWKVSGAQGLSFSRRNERMRLEAELFFGEDYIETDYNLQRGLARDVFFGAATAGLSYRFGSVEPFVRASALKENFTSSGSGSVEGVLGSRYYVIDELQLAVERKPGS